MSIILTIIAFSFVIFIHELGHFLFARIGGIGVIEFSIGMGPKLASFRRKKTQFSLRALPIGGYVKLAGLDLSEDSVDEKTFFQNRPLKYRFLTILAGSFMNLILGYFLFFIVSLFVGEAFVSSEIKQVTPGYPSAVAGLQEGDVIIALNGNTVNNVFEDFISIVNKSGDQFSIEVLRSGKSLIFQCNPTFDSKKEMYRIGVVFSTQFKKVSFFNNFSLAYKKTLSSLAIFVETLKHLFSGNASASELSGPIGIFQFANYQFQQGFFQFLSMFGLISILLGMMNLLPLPVLDGGHLMFLIYEFLFNKPVPESVKIVLNNIFAILLISLMIFITFNDINLWSSRVKLLDTLK